MRGRGDVEKKTKRKVPSSGKLEEDLRLQECLGNGVSKGKGAHGGMRGH